MNFLSKIPTFGLERLFDIDVRPSISLPDVEVNKKTVTYGVAWIASVMALGYIGFRAFLHMSNEKKKNMSDDEDLKILDRKIDIVNFLRSPAYGNTDMSLAMALAVPLSKDDMLTADDVARIVANLCNQYYAHVGPEVMAHLTASNDGNINVFAICQNRYAQFVQFFASEAEAEGREAPQGLMLHHWQELAEVCLSDIFLGARAEGI